MIAPTKPINERERLADLRATEILDTPSERRFDRVVELARRAFGVPIGYIAMIDSDRQWFKAKCGISTEQTSRDESFCGHTILQDGAMVVEDAREDDRFFDNPLVTGEPYIRFYAGQPLRGPGGHNVGTLCLADTQPRTLDENQLNILRVLAEQAEQELAMVSVISAQRELLETKNQLVAAQQKMAEEIADAAEYVRSMLPKPIGHGPVQIDFRYIASSQLGGDQLGYHWLDDDHLSFYLLDVSGHGIGPSLLGASVHAMLNSGQLGDQVMRDPARVLQALNRAFPMEQHGNRFFTIWYGVYHAASRELRYAVAGHHPAFVFESPEHPPLRLGEPGLMIGVLPDTEYQTLAHTMPEGSWLYLFSDGLFELRNGDDAMLGLKGLADLMHDVARTSDDTRVDEVRRRLIHYQGHANFDDDFSLLELTFS